MTREEAIALMKRNADGYYPQMTEALNMAIKALSAEPCEDAVSRQAVLDVLMPYCADDDGSVEKTDDLRNALDDIESLPPVHIRSKGEWIEGISENGVTTNLHCSKCRYEDERCNRFNYCPNCGADMRGEYNG